MKTIHCSNTNDFWEKISPIGKYLESSTGSNFIFRGQYDAQWEIIPNIFRSDSLSKNNFFGKKNPLSNSNQRTIEWFLLSEFVRNCDISGLQIPGESNTLRKHLKFPRPHSPLGQPVWPNPDLYSLMALAQHHGVPTRLIDWTFSSYVAAFFAASGAVEKPNFSDSLAVYAFDQECLNRVEHIKMVRVPGSASQNMTAQRGVFLVMETEGDSNSTFEEDISIESKLPSDEDCLIKFTLSHEYANELLIRCNRFGINAATIFPGYDGAAKAVSDSANARDFIRKFNSYQNEQLP